ncbi:4-hydroxy-tetrahydrodipicolinate synthase [Xylanibacillus composti]|uniref:4-hydroxy-tetrahydrodipicolinate synthase n=1 Tax=Xylanibacillus composti TaxID=1572762 RepID=A0A8J4M1Z4_9BACL|nr:4-hydroxy-tetrahydrodipicolinate synthase [Xylanibacillus composti]GIQ68585.1 4-hydroxy-tetrahydrodipicolinate synthase [Xylanibacillus composti]
MDFGKVITAMVTPFDANGEIDWARTAELIEHLIVEQETDGLVVCGTTGESPTLSDEEKLRLFAFAVEKANKRCAVLAGTGSNNTAHSIHLSKEAEKLGVDGLLLVAPYYNRPTQEGLYQHFQAIAESTDLPVMLYNIPKRTGVNINPETTIRLSFLDNVVAVKESIDLEQIAEIRSHAAEGFRIYSGDDGMTLPILSVGGYGVVSVASHLIGKEIRAMINAFEQGNPEEAGRLHRELLPIFNGLFVCPNPVPVKYALGLKGLPVGSVRLPLVEANEHEKKLISQLFA